MKSSVVKPIKIRPSFKELCEFRGAWRAFHEVQDRDGAERVFREAGVMHTSDEDLKFFPEIFRNKLNEFGRDWERSLAAQGLRESYNFYRIQLEINVSQVDDFHQWIEKKLDGTGSSLFFESNGLHGIDAGVWHALFYFTLEPSARIAEIQFTKAPGILSRYQALRIS